MWEGQGRTHPGGGTPLNMGEHLRKCSTQKRRMSGLKNAFQG